MKKFKFFSFLLLIVALLSVTPKVFADAALSFEKDEIVAEDTIVEGVKYQKFTANSVNDTREAGRQSVNMMSIAPGSAQVISWSIPSGNGIKPSTVMAMAEDYEAKHPNMMVIAAINNDYFGKTGDVFSMRNPSVCDGVVYRNTGIGNMHGLGIAENNVYKLSQRGEVLTVSDNYILEVYDPKGLMVVKTIELSGFNALPEEGKTSVCYGTALITEYPQGEIFEVNATAASRIDTTYYIEGQVTGSVSSINKDAPAILTTDEELGNLLASGAKIKVYKTLAGEWADYDFVLGCPAQMLRDGNVLSVADIGDYGTDHVTARHPRTSIGFKEDGTMVLMVIDGRQPNLGMDGVSERENALALKNEGCINAFNFDGGGSSTFIVRKNGKLTVVNSPSDGGERSDANCLLVVVPKTSIDLEYSTKVESDGTVTVTGAANIETFNGFSYNSAVLYVNGLATELNAEDFELRGLLPGRDYTLSVVLIYTRGASNAGGHFYSEELSLNGSIPNVDEPEIIGVDCEATANGFKLKVNVDDALQEITKLTATYNGRAVNFSKSYGYFTANVFGGTPESVKFDIKYEYRDGLKNTKEGVFPFSYIFGEEPELLVEPEGFEVNLTENEDGKYEAQVTYTANDATNVEVYAVIGEEEVLLNEETLLETKEFDKLVVKYNIGSKEKELELSEFKLNVTPFEGEDEPKPDQGGNTGGGMSCSFGAVWTTSIISLLALAVLVIKRK